MPAGFRHVLFGVIAASAALYLTFFAAAGAIEVVTLVAATVALIWLATVEVATLRGRRGNLRLDLVILLLMGLALIISGSLLLRSGTMLVAMMLGLVGAVIGVVRVTRRAV